MHAETDKREMLINYIYSDGFNIMKTSKVFGMQEIHQNSPAKKSSRILGTRKYRISLAQKICKDFQVLRNAIISGIIRAKGSVF